MHSAIYVPQCTLFDFNFAVKLGGLDEMRKDMLQSKYFYKRKNWRIQERIQRTQGRQFPIVVLQIIIVLDVHFCPYFGHASAHC